MSVPRDCRRDIRGNNKQPRRVQATRVVFATVFLEQIYANEFTLDAISTRNLSRYRLKNWRISVLGRYK